MSRPTVTTRPAPAAQGAERAHAAPRALPEGDVRNDLRAAAAALDRAEAAGHPAAIAQALLTLARAYRRLGALPAAVHCLDAALRWTHGTAAGDARAELLCERAETQVRLGEETQANSSAGGDGGYGSGAARAACDRARDDAFEAAVMADRVADGQCSATLLLRASDVLDRCGDHGDALQLQLRALDHLHRASGGEGVGIGVGVLDNSLTPGSRAEGASA